MKNKPKLIICSNHVVCPEMNCVHREPHTTRDYHRNATCLNTNCRLGHKCKEIKS